MEEVSENTETLEKRIDSNELPVLGDMHSKNTPDFEKEDEILNDSYYGSSFKNLGYCFARYNLRRRDFSVKR